jgi:HD superfamily phosphohydrolase
MFEIRDPVHGFISLNELEWDVVNHPAFQRLRRIKQLAWTDYIYPGATHTRFEHSLGAMHVTSRLFHGVCERNKDLLNSEFSINAEGIGRQGKVMRLAALLHDVGHAPFSHAAEEVFPTDPATGKHFEHEQYSAAIVEYELKDVIENHQFNRRNYGITVAEIRSVFSEKQTTEKDLVWKLLVSGQMDADRMDYLLRDSLHAGVSYGRYDLDRIAATITLCREPETGNYVIGVEDGGTHAVEGLLIARFMMFTQIYYHKTRTIYDYHLVEALKEILKPIGGTFPDPASAESIRKYMDWDDWKVLGALKDSKAGAHGEILLKRAHFRRVYETNEVPAAEELEKFEKVYSALQELGGVEREAEKSWYKFKKEGIRVRKESSATGESVELSTISPVVKGLQGVRQRRIYVPAEKRAEAKKVIEKLAKG